MKQVLLFLLAVFFTAATTQAQDVMDQLADDVCTCINKQEGQTATMEDLQLALGLCLFDAAQVYEKELKKKHKIDLTNERDIERLGGTLGAILATSCPTFRDILFNQVLGEETEAEETSTSAAPTGSLTGTLEELKEERFAVLVVKESSGRSHELVWLSYFEGSQGLYDNFASFKGKTVVVTFREFESFLPQANDYFNVKEIRSLTVIE